MMTLPDPRRVDRACVDRATDVAALDSPFGVEAAVAATVAGGEPWPSPICCTLMTSSVTSNALCIEVLQWSGCQSSSTVGNESGTTSASARQAGTECTPLPSNRLACHTPPVSESPLRLPHRHTCATPRDRRLRARAVLGCAAWEVTVAGRGVMVRA